MNIENFIRLPFCTSDIFLDNKWIAPQGIDRKENHHERIKRLEKYEEMNGGRSL